MSVIGFDAESHRYFVDGVERRSVTQVIKSAGLIDDRWFTEESRLRGTAVHQACHYADQNDLDPVWMETSPLAGYVKAWLNFKKATGLLPELIEHRVYSPAFDYCGTLDVSGSMLLKYAPEIRRCLIDRKTGPACAWHGVQLAAYAAALTDKPMGLTRVTVHLQEDGTYSAVSYSAGDYLRDWDTFVACLQIDKFKRLSGGYYDAGGSRTATTINAA